MKSDKVRPRTVWAKSRYPIANGVTVSIPPNRHRHAIFFFPGGGMSMNVSPENAENITAATAFTTAQWNALPMMEMGDCVTEGLAVAVTGGFANDFLYVFEVVDAP